MTLLQSGITKSLAGEAYEIDNSVRFNADDDPSLVRDISSVTTSSNFTFSCWFKAVDSNSGPDASTQVPYRTLYASGNTDAWTTIGLASNSGVTDTEDLCIRYGDMDTAAAMTTRGFSNNLIRDYSAWYHLVVSVDMSLAAASRVRAYLNGVQLTFINVLNPTTDRRWVFDKLYVGRSLGNAGGSYPERPWDGYMAEVYMLDGQTKVATDFGELDSDTNQWIPLNSDDVKDAVTFGTDGFYLKYGTPHGVEAFTTAGSHTWTCPAGVTAVEVLTVAGGGGGGGHYYAGGGGAGGIVHASSYAVTAGVVYDITVGGGGAGSSSGQGTNGSDSVWNVNAEGSGLALTAKGGGGGGNNGTGNAGGSGGGGTGWPSTSSDSASNQADFSGATSYGNVGRASSAVSANNFYGAGGGGGAGAAGPAQSGNTGGTGGAGQSFATFSGYGVAGVFGGGGGGSSGSTGGPGPGGTGGGGAGASTGSTAAVVGTANTGGGGGGGAHTNIDGGNGKAGGLGVVLISVDAGLGADSSGEGNNFTVTNLVATDQMLDTPTNNFATLNPIIGNAGTIIEGNLVFDPTTAWHSTAGTFGATSGKWYFEYYVFDKTNNGPLGVRDNVGLWDETGGPPGYCEYAPESGGQIYLDGLSTISSVGTFVATDIIGVAVNMDDGEIQWFKNDAVLSGSGNVPVTMPVTTAAGFLPYLRAYGPGKVGANFGQDSSFAGTVTAQGNQDDNGKGDFYYAPPSGFLALCTSNLASPEIALPTDHFDTTIWTGDGVSGAMSTTGLSFQPDFFFQAGWNGGGGAHLTYDAVRGFGNNKELTTNSTGAEGSENADEYGYVSGVTSDGVTYGQGSLGVSSGIVYYNTSGAKYVLWNWKGDGVAGGTLNEVGATDSQVNANTTAGFSIVTFTAPTTATSIGHGLTQKPELIIIKDTGYSGSNWPVMRDNSNPTSILYLNLINAAGADASTYTAVAATTFSIGTSTDLNYASPVAYCFHSVEGYSKIGVYPGNGDPDGPFIYLGFRPAWIMVKGYAGTDDWIIMDSKRAGYNSNNDYLDANNATAETDGSGNIDFCSNGFKIRSAFSSINYVTGDYLYIAFADTPFKTANAR